MSKRRLLWVGAALVWFASIGLATAAEDFPGRAMYWSVPVIGTEELARRFPEFSIVDVRSAYEYNTLHIKGATNIPLSSRGFVDAVRELVRAEGKPVVFYCNGHTCMKSYQAATKAQKAGLTQVYAYDSGIFDWVKAYPEQGVFLGKSPVPLDRLLSKEQLQAHMLPPAEFAKRARAENGIILDVRDPAQREGISLFLGRERDVPLDNQAIAKYVHQAKKEGRPLFILDAVGKQVRWLQYFLEQEGLHDYYFMQGGARAFLRDLIAGEIGSG
ncbi:MAG TPA: hypothetical protein ENK62_08775 [Chromatiales bacterium]|nr:hypothetical protein [Chromatiales bacterium]